MKPSMMVIAKAKEMEDSFCLEEAIHVTLGAVVSWSFLSVPARSSERREAHVMFGNIGMDEDIQIFFEICNRLSWLATCDDVVVECFYIHFSSSLTKPRVL